MGSLHRITFRFAGHMEVRYLTRLPEVGERVSHDRDLWVVTSVELDPVGALVDCELGRSKPPALFAREREGRYPR